MQCWWNRRGTNCKIPVCFIKVKLKFLLLRLSVPIMFCVQDSSFAKASYSSFTCCHFCLHIYSDPCMFFSFFFAFVQGMLFRNFNLRLKVQLEFLVCFDGCEVSKTPLFNSNIVAAKKKRKTYFGSFYPVENAVNCPSGTPLLVVFT